MYNEVPIEEEKTINSTDHTNDLAYNDEFVNIDNDGISINKYIYPLNTKKVILFKNIKSAEMIEMGRASGKYTFIGLTWTLVWLHMDRRRPHKTHCIVIDDGSMVKSGITPNDPNTVYSIIKQSMPSIPNSQVSFNNKEKND